MAKKATPKKKSTVKKKTAKPVSKIAKNDTAKAVVNKVTEEHRDTQAIIIPLSQEKIIRDVYAKGLDDGEFEVFKMIA